MSSSKVKVTKNKVKVLVLIFSPSTYGSLNMQAFSFYNVIKIY